MVPVLAALPVDVAMSLPPEDPSTLLHVEWGSSHTLHSHYSSVRNPTPLPTSTPDDIAPVQSPAGTSEVPWSTFDSTPIISTESAAQQNVVPFTVASYYRPWISQQSLATRTAIPTVIGAVVIASILVYFWARRRVKTENMTAIIPYRYTPVEPAPAPRSARKQSSTGHSPPFDYYFPLHRNFLPSFSTHTQTQATVDPTEDLDVESLILPSCLPTEDDEPLRVEEQRRERQLREKLRSSTSRKGRRRTHYSAGDRRTSPSSSNFIPRNISQSLPALPKPIVASI